MTVLEVEGRREGTPQGVVLALVGPESASQHHSDSMRALRMYNLASLTSLARWAVAQKVRSIRTAVLPTDRLRHRVRVHWICTDRQTGKYNSLPRNIERREALLEV